MTDINQKKAELRKWARQTRQMITDGDTLSQAIAAHADAFADLSAGSVIAGYWPKGAEVDVRYLLDRLESLGHSLALPVMQGPERPLIFRRWKRGDDLVPGPFHVQEPMEDSPQVTPDLLLVPLLAFDAEGWRLGYGGGFYDRTLDELRANPQVRSVGVAFNAQQVPEIPHDDFDRRLDGVLTETGLVWVEKA